MTMCFNFAADSTDAADDDGAERSVAVMTPVLLVVVLEMMQATMHSGDEAD